MMPGNLSVPISGSSAAATGPVSQNVNVVSNVTDPVAAYNILNQLKYLQGNPWQGGIGFWTPSPFGPGAGAPPQLPAAPAEQSNLKPWLWLALAGGLLAWWAWRS